MFSPNRVKPHSGNMRKAVLRYAGFRIKNPRKKEEVGHTVREQGVCKLCMEEGYKVLPSATRTWPWSPKPEKPA